MKTMAVSSAPTLMAAVLFAICTNVPAVGAPPLELMQTIPLPGVTGKFDHLAIDLASKRLFVAAKINNTLEIVDLKAGRRTQSLAGFHEPQGVLFLRDAQQVVVANGGNGDVQFLDGTSLALIRHCGFGDDADNLRYDGKTRRVYVACADGALGVVDANTGTKLGEVALPAHPEAFSFETQSDRMFVNVPKANTVFVLDRRQPTITATWPLTAAKVNYTMAIDEPHKRLFVGCREPARLLVLDTATGRTITTVPIGAETDCIFYDGTHRRIYVTGTEGTLDVIKQLDDDHYEAVAQLTTAPVARTCLYVPELDQLFLAVPQRPDHDAEVWIYKALH